MALPMTLFDTATLFRHRAFNIFPIFGLRKIEAPLRCRVVVVAKIVAFPAREDAAAGTATGVVSQSGTLT